MKVSILPAQLFYYLCLLTLVFFSACGDDQSPMLPEDEEVIYFDPETYGDDIVVLEKSTPGAFIYSATWCEPCSSVSKPALSDLLASSYASEALFLSCHIEPSSSLYSEHAGDIASMLGGTGGTVSIPFVKFSDKSGFENPGTATAMVSNIEAKIDELKQNDVVANAGYRAKIEGNMLSVKTNTQFFAEGTGSFSVSPILYEDKVSAEQFGLGVVDHDVIMRRSVEGSSTKIEGISFDGVSHPAGTVYENEFTFDLDPSWNIENLRVAVVVWSRNISGFSIVNIAI